MGDKSMAVHKLEQAVELVNLADDDTDGGAATMKFTPTQVRDFKGLFGQFDRDNDFSLDERELASVLRALGQNPTTEELRQLIHEADLDGNGKLEEAEYYAFLEKNMQSRKEVEQELTSAFKTFVRAPNGKLSKKDLMTVLRRYGDPLTVDQANELMDVMDSNKDNFIDVKEFTSFLCSGYPDLQKDGDGQKTMECAKK